MITRRITEVVYAEKKLKDALKEKEVLLREIQHRVKNNFQIVISLMNLQESAQSEQACMNEMRKATRRIASMALVHEMLRQSRNLSMVDFREYLQKLGKMLLSAIQPAPGRPILSFDLESVSLEFDQAIPCALIANELMANAMHHAFPECHIKDGAQTPVGHAGRLWARYTAQGSRNAGRIFSLAGRHRV